MKKTYRILLLLFLILPTVLSAQEEVAPRVFHHEIGTDFTGLIEKFLNANEGQDFDVSLVKYLFIYRKYFEQFNLRTGVGIDFNFRNRELTETEAEDTYQVNTVRLNYRIGIEKHSVLSKYWNFHYGLDFRHDYFSQLNERFFITNNDYRIIFDQKWNTIGFAPVIGIVFKINKRISIQSEASLYGFISRSKEKQSYAALETNPSAQPPELRNKESFEFGSQFLIPNFLSVNIKL